MRKILVLGSINIDNVAYTKVIPVPGITVEGDSFLSNIGGKGANQACAIHFLKSDVTFIGAVGKDEAGLRVEKYFQELGLNYHLIKSDKNTGTALIIIDENTAENRILCVPGANFDIKKEDIDEIESKMSKGDILLTQFECDMDTLCYAIRKAKEKEMIVILNPAPYRDNFPIDIYPLIDYFIPNEHEMDGYVPGDMSYFDKGEIILQKGAKNVIVTLGEKGSIAINKDEKIVQNPIKVHAIDTTAAGDSFCGAFASAIANDISLKEAMLFATRCSSITVTRKGAISSLPKKEDI